MGSQKYLILKTGKHKVYTKYQIALYIDFFFFFTDPGLKRYFLMTNLHLIFKYINEISYRSVSKMANTLCKSSYLEVEAISSPFEFELSS